MARALLVRVFTVAVCLFHFPCSDARPSALPFPGLPCCYQTNFTWVSSASPSSAESGYMAFSAANKSRSDTYNAYMTTSSITETDQTSSGTSIQYWASYSYEGTGACHHSIGKPDQCGSYQYVGQQSFNGQTCDYWTAGCYSVAGTQNYTISVFFAKSVFQGTLTALTSGTYAGTNSTITFTNFKAGEPDAHLFIPPTPCPDTSAVSVSAETADAAYERHASSALRYGLKHRLHTSPPSADLV